MAQDPWAEFEEVRPVAARAPQPVISLPNPDKQADNSRADRGQANSDTTTGIAVRGEARDVSNTAFQQTQDLRKAYESTPEVKNYRVVIPQLIDALKTPDDASGDNALLYAYSKIMDPTSVVRESETASAASGASVFDQTVANLKKQFGIEGGGQLAPDVRKGLKRQALARAQELGKIYRAQRQRYTDDAGAFGIDPARVIGPDDFDPYRADFERLRGDAKDPTTQDIYGGGVQFGMDAPGDQPFDRTRYLESIGIPAGKEDAVVGFWTANSGNPNLTPQAVAAWYQQNGIAVPDNASLMQSIETARKLAPGTRWGAIDTSQAEEAYRNQLRGQLNKEGFDPTSGGAYGARAVRGAEMGLTDEIQGIQGGIEALFNNRGVADGYRLERDKVREAYSQMEDQQGALGTAAELGGGLGGALLIPSGATRGVSALARQGAVQGAVSGFGYGDGLGGSVGGAVTGAGIGMAGGAAFGKGGEMLAARAVGRAAQPLTDGGEVISAADRLNSQFGTDIAPLPADVAGVTTRRITGGVAQLPLAAGSIVSGGQRVSTEAQAALEAIAGLAGAPTTREAAGEAALTGAQKFIKNSRNKVNVLYAKARSLGGDEPVDLAEARKTLDDNIAELSQTPGGADGLTAMQALRSELDKPYGVEAVRRMRTQMRDKFMKDGLRGSDTERRIGMVLDAADDDITASLNAAGKGDAARAYAEASAAHKERVQVIDQVLAPIIGNKGDAPRSVEQVLSSLETATKTNGGRLGKFLASLPDEDAASVRGTLVQELGKANAGAQNAAGDAFSLGSFLTNWNKMSSSAKSQMFGGELRAALEDLARVAQGTKEAQRFANSSNTGSVIGGVALGGNIAAFFSSPVASTAAMLGQFGAGKLLASPGFARWLAKMPSNPALAEKHVAALSKIAANDNVIAADVGALQTELLGWLGQSRSAATPPIGADPASSQTEARRPQGEGQ
ncbi:hypothetical protein [Novosphingobium sp. MMS21-SN21R]|uniref:hypothetical protein n=1 Tax=Novosphingobium sp. MMS21-SN21R TaxID=2969298 RepID=UPI002887F128|nr:hypothetical protein [Novosphingobium sp. MMS21-SN21R]MDT0507536.1 hypothetical protein [Novosphingobium sp. MMS21-SN21R]